jgi:hypothetical protein
MTRAMTRAEAEALARRLICSSMAQSVKIARIADAFEAAYDDGVRDEAIRWGAGTKLAVESSKGYPR